MRTMTFSRALQETADGVNRLLDSLLPTAGAAAPRLVEAMRYASLDAGKRLRPFLVVEAARLVLVLILAVAPLP